MSRYQPSEAELQEIKRLLSYDPATGALTWLVTNIGRPFGSRADWSRRGQHKTYRYVAVLGRRWRAHSLAFFLFHGFMPLKQIDHIDGDGCNNAINNLRDVSPRENQRNRKLTYKSTSGVLGVTWHKRRKAWLVQIGVDNKPVRLGQFQNLEDAIRVRRAAEVEHGYHPNHGRVETSSANTNTSKKICPIDVTCGEFIRRPSRAITRVTLRPDPADARSWYEITVWPASRHATVFGNPFDLPRNEFRILEILVLAQGLTVSRGAIWAHLYGTHFDPSSRAVDMQVSRLRAKLRESNAFLRATREGGYRLECRSPSLASIIAGNRFKQVEPPSCALETQLEDAAQAA
jgi:DNA-binding winged helix-turn-helix (wHTH) protein